MLHRLHIKNIALISEADIEFDDKLNVLSGETGSGKSVILDSINFVLGSKADKTMIRFGEQEATVRAEFIVDENSAAAEILREYDIETDGEIIITRRLNVDGKGSIKLNGNTVTATMLKSVTQHLVDVHGQSEHFFLLNEENQLKVIDGICGAQVAEIKHNLADLIAQKRELKSKIAALGGDESERERKLDLLKFQISEIESAELKVGEFEELKARQNIIANTEKIFSALNTAHSLLSDDGGSIDGISSSKHYLNTISGFGEDYEQIAARLENLSVEASDIAETLSDLADNLTFDEQEASYIDERLTLIKALKKKYGEDEEHILRFLEDAKAEYDAISDSANAIEKYEKGIFECDGKIFALCQKLTDLRKNTADKFCKAVTAELKTLNIQNASFEVQFNEYDRQTANLQSANGSDIICFMFSANKGEPLKPLSKVISGGEMSRFMLAVKTQLKDLNGISTYIFDEIDAGISGYTAKTVAEKFIKISQNTQILAVSHLPQVCAASSAQFLIYKVEESAKTLTKVKRLTDDEKISEIVRLTGSVKSDAATEHARELINQFKN
ncbi:MAG: DNA repair protein RecN [Clostridiales bacterium]|nr:DNA repair protein RecN [Clostridiales bacterium]